MQKELGFISKIFPVEQFQGKDGKTYQKRRLWIDNTYVDRLGQRSASTSIVEIEFTGDKTTELNNYQVGQAVIVSYSLHGNITESRTTGESVCYVKLHGFKVELYGNQQPQVPQQYQTVQQPQVQRTPQYQQPQYQGQQQYQQQQPPQNQPMVNGKSDMPF